MSKLFVHAPNVHQGGGAVLLYDLLQSLPSSIEVIVQVDERMVLPPDLGANVKVMQIKPRILRRLGAERHLVSVVGLNDRVLCFGNLPPLFKLKGDVIVFLQNRYLVDPCAPMSAMPLKPRTRLWLERAWLRMRRFNAAQYVVQTPSMKRLASQQLGVSVSCMPFVPTDVLKMGGGRAGQQFDFLYVASGEAHKNHAVLIDAWGMLADDGVFPSLALTLAPEAAPGLCASVAKAAARGLRIQNVGVLSHGHLLEMYRVSGALIYPSSFESFGLPLIEAREAGLSILAPELDYVRDVTDPDEAFDPHSPISIARAVKRFLKKAQPRNEPLGAGELIAQILAVHKP